MNAIFLLRTFLNVFLTEGLTLTALTLLAEFLSQKGRGEVSKS